MVSSYNFQVASGWVGTFCASKDPDIADAAATTGNDDTCLYFAGLYGLTPLLDLPAAAAAESKSNTKSANDDVVDVTVDRQTVNDRSACRALSGNCRCF
jgi:hypothetical protein